MNGLNEIAIAHKTKGIYRMDADGSIFVYSRDPLMRVDVWVSSTMTTGEFAGIAEGEQLDHWMEWRYRL